MDSIVVPYHSQWGAGANLIAADCGEACALMLVQAYGKALDRTVDQFVALIKDWNGFTDAQDLSNLLTQFELKPVVGRGDPLAPSICLIRYGAFKERLDQNYKALHWVVYLGTEGEEVIVHDPDFWTGSGESRRYPLAEWQAGYTGLYVGVAS